MRLLNKERKETQKQEQFTGKGASPKSAGFVPAEGSYPALNRTSPVLPAHSHCVLIQCRLIQVGVRNCSGSRHSHLWFQARWPVSFARTPFIWAHRSLQPVPTHLPFVTSPFTSESGGVHLASVHRTAPVWSLFRRGVIAVSGPLQISMLSPGTCSSVLLKTAC